jgi:hypothetical protein
VRYAHCRHCEQSEAIYNAADGGMVCFAPLAITDSNEQQ